MDSVTTNLCATRPLLEKCVSELRQILLGITGEAVLGLALSRQVHFGPGLSFADNIRLSEMTNFSFDHFTYDHFLCDNEDKEPFFGRNMK